MRGGESVFATPHLLYLAARPLRLQQVDGLAWVESGERLPLLGYPLLSVVSAYSLPELPFAGTRHVISRSYSSGRKGLLQVRELRHGRLSHLL